MIKKKLLFLTTLLSALPLVLGVANWNLIPQDIPVHWEAIGEADRFAPKAVVVFLLPLAFVTIHILCHFLATREEVVESRTSDFEGLIYWFIPLLSIVCCSIGVFSFMGVSVKLSVLVCAVIDYLCIFAVVWLARLRKICGENSEKKKLKPLTQNQKKAILFTQNAVCISGTLSIVCSFCGALNIGFIIIAASLLISLCYSLILHKKRK